MKTDKELIEEVRALQNMGAKMIDEPTCTALADRLEAANAEIERLKSHNHFMINEYDRIIKAKFGADNEIERLKGLIRWFHNRHEDLLEIDDEDGCVDYDAPEKAAIAKIGKEKP